jgi:CHAD domain-containing protein
MAKAKKIHGLHCDAPAAGGICLVFTTRISELLEWRQAALDWSDPEGVHSMRVASRRLRSAMRDFLPYVPKRSFTSVVKRLKALADALGAVRDQDVAIPALEAIEKKAPSEHLAALKELIEKRKQLREQQRKKLKAVLAKTELKKLQSEFSAAVEEAAAAAERKNKRNSPPTFTEASQSVIRDRLKEFEKRSNGLFTPLDAEALHELRIATKRLRYAIELLAPCFDRSMMTHAKRAARLQTSLGELHDCDSWILSIGAAVTHARKEKADAQVAAFVWLLNHFTRLRTKHLDSAFVRWSEWEAHDSSGKLRAAVSSQKPAPEPEVQPEAAESRAQAVGETDAASLVAV